MKLSERILSAEWYDGIPSREDLADEVRQLEAENDELKNKNRSMMKLAAAYIKAYEDLAFAGALKESE